MNNTFSRIEDDPEAMRLIALLQSKALEKGYTLEQLAEAVKRYWRKLECKEAKENNNAGN